MMSRARTCFSPLFQFEPPLAVIPRFQKRQQFLQNRLGVADDPHIRGHVLVDLGRINVYVDDLRMRKITGEVAGHAIVKAHPYGDDQVGILDSEVGIGLAMHPHHAQTPSDATLEWKRCPTTW